MDNFYHNWYTLGKIRLGKGSHPIKNLFLFAFFQKGGGSCPKPNFLRNFLVLFMFGHFSGRGVAHRGRLPDSKTFQLAFGHFSDYSKDDEEKKFLTWTFFQ